MSEVQLIGCFFKPTEQGVLGDSLHGVDTQMLTKDSHSFCMGFSISMIFSVDDHTDFFDNLCSMTYLIIIISSLYSNQWANLTVQSKAIWDGIVPF